MTLWPDFIERAWMMEAWDQSPDSAEWRARSVLMVDEMVYLGEQRVSCHSIARTANDKYAFIHLAAGAFDSARNRAWAVFDIAKHVRPLAQPLGFASA